MRFSPRDSSKNCRGTRYRSRDLRMDQASTPFHTTLMHGSGRKLPDWRALRFAASARY